MGYALENPRPLNYYARGRYAIHYFDAGEYLIKECTRAEGIYRIRSGMAKVVCEDKEGKQHIIGILGAGDFIGMEALLGDACYRMSVIALEDLSAYYLTQEQMKALLDVRPSLYGVLLDRLHQLLARVDAIELEGKDSRTSGQRLASVILELYERFAEENGCLDVDVSQSDLANFAGISRQTFYRIINRWKEAGILDIKNHQLCIKAPERLEQLAT